ncbi:MBL fold metallo-hydrolase [Pseudonocardia acidicola]|uniref:MBL fold metallo-hydrolase n=1 Tax=Pseudonocardia acidicola TaxID=2724939 RepID=A0ABX1SMP1_9PSEU|nr:MBL fold metallo-hydrolase [Pseudonocardia acidicola]NMI02285.1 MBL fold metallo-hydrolase [Pseudonocardia acidicola]
MNLAPGPGLALTVLGSGGPFVNPWRASSGQLVWLDGRARLLIDAGGGVFERLGRTGADPAGLDAVLLTHLHADHSGDLPAVVFAGYLAERNRPLTVVGPSDAGGDGHQPGTTRFCELLFGTDGAWRYLHSFDGFGIDARDTSSDPAAAPRAVLDLGDLRVSSVGVPHGMMPAVAYRIDAAGASVVISGDVQRHHPPLAELARGVDLLIHDMALPERDVPHGHLHAKPSEVGRVAADAGCRALLLTHVMPLLEGERTEAERLVRENFPGEVSWADDLRTLPVLPPPVRR